MYVGCGHCKALEPKFKRLGKKFGKVDSVRIAKIDATANDIPDEFAVSGMYVCMYAIQENVCTACITAT